MPVGVYVRSLTAQTGINNNARKLTEEQIHEIRLSKLSSYKIAPLYDINPSHIRRIRSGVSWNHLT